MIALVLLVLLVAPAAAWAESDPKSLLRAMEDAFTSVADHVMPAVVNITTSPPRGRGPTAGPGPRERSEPFAPDPFFRRPPREDPRASGSGVIVDPNGYILTNNHVIENAQGIEVRLSDGRKFSGKLIGRDPKSDLAVLKIDAPAPLPMAQLGDSDRLRIGQWAIAIGSPFGLDRTVTVGIISATARTRVGVATYESFIQTDASINPGNSGGPLLNIDGEVIGVNTAIVAAGQGIGFSIPINMAKDVMSQLIARGRVVRGWLGIVIQDVTEELGSSFGVSENQGVLVSDVMQGGPAESAGLRPGDVITELAGARITDVPELQRRVASVSPGESIVLNVLRDQRPVSVTVKVGEMPGEETTLAVGADENLGLVVESVGPELAEQLKLPVAHGVVVTEVDPDSPAAKAGLQPGDVVLEINREPVDDLVTFRKLVGRARSGEGMRLYVHRLSKGGGKEYLVLEKPAR
jgi:Do/DeqQ family serine protease